MIFLKTYDITKHPMYKELSDYNPKNEFDIKEYVSNQLRLRKDEDIDIYNVGYVGGTQ